MRLLVTELVANSVRHAGLDETDRITLMLELSDTRVRVEVRDPGRGFAFPVRPQKLTAEGGRGLQIVAAIAHRWGVERSEPIAVGSRSTSSARPVRRTAPACRARACAASSSSAGGHPIGWEG